MDKKYQKMNDEFRNFIEQESKITDEIFEIYTKFSDDFRMDNKNKDDKIEAEISEKIAELGVCLEEKNEVMKEMENNSC